MIDHLQIHICTPAFGQMLYYTALRGWLLEQGHTVLLDPAAPLDNKLKAAARCDLCILILGSHFGPCAPLSFFSDTELEVSAAVDAHPGKLLVFAQAEIDASMSPEQWEFVERQRHFVGGTFQATFHTAADLVLLASNAITVWHPPLPKVHSHPIKVPPNAIMISSIGDLRKEREAVRAAIEAHRLPIIDYLQATSESVAPIDRVIQWACTCQALILILGDRYGYVSPVDGLGVTELEFVTAYRASRPILAFFGPNAKKSQDGDQRQFIERVCTLIPTRIFPFQGLADLRHQVERKLTLITDRELPTVPAVIPPQTQRRWYRRQMHRWLGILPHLTQPQGMPLEQVYVSLSLFPITQKDQREQQPDNQEIQEERQQTDQGPSRIFKRESVGQPPQCPPVPIKVDEALTRFPRFILRGNPGAGKSTVLRWYAITASDDIIPVFIRLAAYSRVRQQKAVEGQHYTLMDAIRDLEAYLMLYPRGEFIWSRELQSGKGLVLLDAFDEVPPNQQRFIATEIQALAHQLPKETRIVITTRIAGTTMPFGLDFEVFDVQPLNAARQRLLVGQWMRAAHRNSAKGHAIADARAKRLMRFLEQEWRLSEWARTPLLLTLLAALEDKPGSNSQQIPATKAMVYQRVVRLILGRWRTLDLRQGSEHMTLTRFCGVREEKSDKLYKEANHGQNTTQLYQRI